MAFKIKTKSKFLIEERQTVDAKHNNILQAFTDNKSQIPLLQQELLEITTEMNKLTEEHTKTPIINLELQKKIWSLDDRKKDIETELYNIENNTYENEYMLKTGKILSDYYKILEQEKQFASGINVSSSPNPNSIVIESVQNTDSLENIIGVKKKRITDWFSQQIAPNAIVFENVDTGKKIVNVSRKKSLAEFKNGIKDKHLSTTTDKVDTSVIKLENKDTIYERFMKTIDKNYININNDNIDVFDTCNKCMVEMLLNNNSGMLICPNCGLTENIIVDSDKPSFKEPPKEMTSFCYKRINHLNEFLAQFQAKETTDIPEDVYNEILVEIKKERISNMALITPEKMRTLLKRIRKNDYYEHIPYIINQLNGLPAPVIAPEIEEVIRSMFKAIQIPFEKYCPHKRKNFLSYNYVMYKFFELLELDEYLTCFQLLKSRTKLHQQDLIWKNICKDLNWQFIKSL